MASFCFQIKLTFLLLTILCGLLLVSADIPHPLCSNTSHYVSSPFQNNFMILLDSFKANANASRFYKNSAGSGIDMIHGLYLCYEYLPLGKCKECVTKASDHIVSLCGNSTEAVMWEEDCQLRYSEDRFFGHLDVSNNIPLWNLEEFSDPGQFRVTLNGTFNDLAKQAAFNSSLRQYATAERTFQDSRERKTLYSLVQCTMDLSADECDTCLRTAVSNITNCCYSYIGVRLLSRSCYLRYELYDFYGAPEAPAPTQGNSGRIKTWIIIIVVAIACLLLTIFGFCCFLARDKCRWRGSAEYGDIRHRYRIQLTEFQGKNPFMKLATICAATNNFSDANFLSRGGFGPVYKGTLRDGTDVAVKRLENLSEQGSEEFINEVLLIMRLQHNNLVRLLGFCIDRGEKLLVYEYMPLGSLDIFVFDPRKRSQLDWSTRQKIINGIARGILYLHEDSRLKIIHRDLKASNILLDSDMNPKISDFGLARIFSGAEDEVTATIIGTYGYMAPEYAMDGIYSIKSDVFSFGVLLIEIMTGKRNATFHQSGLAATLIAYAWRLRDKGNALRLMDPLLANTCPPDEFLRFIHIGLLCVQEDSLERPTMSAVAQLLSGETVSICQPKRPAFAIGQITDNHEANSESPSANLLTISDVLPR